MEVTSKSTDKGTFNIYIPNEGVKQYEQISDIPPYFTTEYCLKQITETCDFHYSRQSDSFQQIFDLLNQIKDNPICNLIIQVCNTISNDCRSTNKTIVNLCQSVSVLLAHTSSKDINHVKAEPSSEIQNQLVSVDKTQSENQTENDNFQSRSKLNKANSKKIKKDSDRILKTVKKDLQRVTRSGLRTRHQNKITVPDNCVSGNSSPENSQDVSDNDRDSGTSDVNITFGSLEDDSEEETDLADNSDFKQNSEKDKDSTKSNIKPDVIDGRPHK
ncbi:hypothetical protein LOTGIDRAFT_175415, partial [Lottia gigantea]